MLGAGFLLFVTGTGLATAKGVGSEGKLNPKILAVSIALAIIGAACWTLAVYRA